MASTNDLVSIKMVADRLYRNPIMKDMNYEFIVDNAIQVLRILEAPSIFVTRREALNVSGYRALKPLDLMRIESIVRTDSGLPIPLTASEDIAQEFYHQSSNLPNRPDETYSLNSKYVNLNFESGMIEVIYKAVAVDEDCYPLVLNNATLLRCVESYIRWKYYDILNDMDVISDKKLNKAEVDYMFNVGQADSNLKIPNVDEMESLVNQITQLIPSRTAHSRRFEFLGQQEYLKLI